jgi:uncharacterized membrane protein required for colicin V production
MGLDLLLLTLVCVAAGFGAARGALAGALGLVQLLGAYAAAFLAGAALGPRLAAAAGMPAALGAPCAGLLAFVFAYVLLGWLGRWLRGLEARRVGLARGALDRTLGFAFGALRGGLAAALLAWLALFAEALRATGAAPALPALGDSTAARITSSAVERGTLAALGTDPGSRVAARLAARPAQTLGELDAVFADDRVLELRDDARFWSSVEQGEIDTAMRRSSFVALAHDATLRRRLGTLGLVGEQATGHPAAFRDEMAGVLEEVGPRLRALREDPELQRLMQDPEVIGLARAGDHLALATHPRVRAAVSRAMGSGE